MTHRNMATFALAPGLLEKLLLMPDGIDVVGSEWDFVSRTIRVYIEGECLPSTKSGEIAKNINPLITRNEDGTVTWDFGIQLGDEK